MNLAVYEWAEALPPARPVAFRPCVWPLTAAVAIALPL